LSGARSYLNSIRGRGAFSQTNSVIRNLLPQLSGNVRSSKGRRTILRNLDRVYRGGLTVARSKTQAAKASATRASTQNLASGIRTKARVSLTQRGSAKRVQRLKATPSRAGVSPRISNLPGETLSNKKKLNSRDILILKSNLTKFGVMNQPLKTSASKLSIQQINALSARADAINKRGLAMDAREQKVISFINKLFKENKTQQTKAGTVADNFKPRPLFPNLTKATQKTSGVLGKEIVTVTASTGAILPQRLVQVFDKTLFAGQVVASRTLKGEFKSSVKSLLNESRLAQPAVQRALREGFKDPRTWVYALLGRPTRKGASLPVKTKPVEIAKPRPNSPTANALKNKLVRDPKTNTLYFIDKNANVYRVSVTKDRVNLLLSKREKIPVYEKLGFKTDKQYKSWLKLNEKSKVTSGTKLVKIEKQIIKIENSIVSAKNKALLEKAKNKLKNLAKARKSRSKGKPPKKKPASKAAKKRSDLAKSNKLKGEKTTAAAQAKGFKNFREQQQLTKQGFRTKGEFDKFNSLFVKANKGNVRARAQLNAFRLKLQRRAGKFTVKKTRKGLEIVFKKKLSKAQKLGLETRKKTIKLKKKIEIARKKKISKKATKTVIKQIIQRVRIKGKKAQQFSNIDQLLLQIKQIKQKGTIRRGKLSLRTGRPLLNAPKFKLFLKPKIIPKLSSATLSKFNEISIVKEILTPAYEEKLENAIRNILDDIIKLSPSFKSASASKTNTPQKLRKKLKVIPLRFNRKKTVPEKIPIPKPLKIKLPFDPQVKNPKGFNAWIKTKTGWSKANPKPLTRANAGKIARYVSNNSLAATHLVVGTKARAVKVKVTLDALKSHFRPSKSKSVPKGAKVEKRKRRLNTIGEKRKIRAAKVISRVKARLSRKKPVKKKKAKKKTVKRKKRK
jgi:hypothetical protein